MTSTAIVNGILSLGVIVMVVTPLVWAIRTQHRDHPRPVQPESPTARPAERPERAPARRPQSRPVGATRVIRAR